ncbi:unnamed protein product [Nezara viridula]|uniref:Uncharacterized protein n=1 Tax=Nezara viridula TaxID=85310 RepID=A0A9P0H9B8_NEZVI|nr:unnamed protein product [Nezara viridula]
MFQSQQFDLLLYQLMISDEDFGLLDNMAASVTTYLVIFVQFGHPLAPRN